MNQFIPRPYQNRFENAFFDYYEDGGTGDILFGAPTGTGKSMIPPMIIRRCMAQAPYSRHLICTHVKELISQNASAARVAWPLMPMGVCSAGLSRWEPHAPVVFGGVASMFRKAAQIGHRDVMFIDEAHLAGDSEGSMYQQLIAELKAINPAMKVSGLSATLYRMGQGLLTEGDDALFDHVALDLTGPDEMVKFIDDGYLSELHSRPTQTIIDVSDVRQLAKDFDPVGIAREANKRSVMIAAVNETMALSQGCKKWMVFGAGIENCYNLKELFEACGVVCTVVHSNSKKYPMKDTDRDHRIEAFKDGRIQCIISNNILTTGFDCPGVDLIIDLRPTTSTNLHVQKYGRGIRVVYHPRWTRQQLTLKANRFQAIAEGEKPNGCRVLDFAGNRDRLGPINNPLTPKRRGKGGGDAPTKTCDHCGAAHHPTVRVCDICGFEFVFQVKIKRQSEHQPMVVRAEDIEETKYKRFLVDSWESIIHRKAGSEPSLKVTYWCENRPFSVYLHFQKKGYPKKKACDWWRQHFGDEIPGSTEEAYNWFPRCRRPSYIRADLAKQYAEIKEFSFE